MAHGLSFATVVPNPAFDDIPIRSEMLGPDHLDVAAHAVAADWKVTDRRGDRSLIVRLRDNAASLRKVRESAALRIAAGEPLTPDAEWILDNFFVIEEVLRMVRKDLPSGYYDELPIVREGTYGGFPRIFAVASTLVRHSDSHLDDAPLLRFVLAFQHVAPLSTGELWALPIMLRLALIENLRRLGEETMTARADRQAAGECLNTELPSPLPDRPSDAFLVAFHLGLRDRADAPSPTVHTWLDQHATDLAEVLRREHRRQAANQVTVGNCVTSLRLLNAIDWAAFFEKASPVEAALRTEPTGFYAKQDFATRDRYRQAIEVLSKGAKRAELDVVRAALGRATAAPAGSHAQDVGYHLIGDGRREFARSLGCRFQFREAIRTSMTANPDLTFFGGLGLVSAAFVTAVVVLTGTVGGGWELCLLAGLVSLIPASEVAVAVVNVFITKLLAPRVLPKLDFVDGIPPEFRTMVVIPGMLTRKQSAIDLCERLELHYLANPDPQLRFALLTDWADAATETSPSDQELLSAAVSGIRRLNDKYSSGGPDLFFLFHRKRQFNPSEGVWMGWERKRGKLDDFNRLLRGSTNTAYAVKSADASALRIRFVLTLDTDTVLPRDAARRLIGALAHPLNRAVLSEDHRRVVAGYGVLQPRVSFLYQSGLRSRFARIFAGSAGIDPYSTATSDVYQDLFGAGTFTGKGLYDVDAFHATAGSAFPENAILSHDLIESNFARCGLVTDVEVFDEFPAKYHAYARREHRWVRGDWQLLPWLGRTVPAPGSRKANVIPLVGRWKIFDNLRRSVGSLGLLVLLVAGWVVLPGQAWIWSVLALAVLAVPLALLVMDLVLAILGGHNPRTVLRGAVHPLSATIGQIALTSTFLANQATIAADAITRTLCRLIISRKHLLEWETAASAEARLDSHIRSFVASMWPAWMIALVLGATVAGVNPDAMFAASPWLLAWFLSPVVAWAVSRPLGTTEVPLTEPDRLELRRIARKTWRFFEQFTGDTDNWLPPDNFQEDPKGVVAHRTSPTNIGLLLLSTLSARDLGYVTLSSASGRLRKTFDTLDKLERQRGHFLNWYETTTLQTLHPAYVSTVDSGNLLGCLLAFRNGITELLNEPVPSRSVVDGLRDTLTLASESVSKSDTNALQIHFATTPSSLVQWHTWLITASDLIAKLPESTRESGLWTRALLDHTRLIQEELAAVCPWVSVLPGLRESIPTGSTHPDWVNELDTPSGIGRWQSRIPTLQKSIEDWALSQPEPIRSMVKSLTDALERSLAPVLASELDDLSRRAGRFADAMDFRFLYNDARHLFSIGYNVSLERLDSAHYDLIASECCLTSYLAVARGVVPRKHWFQLGRLVTRVAGQAGLVSWGGTMFEYLMPRLLLRPPSGTMLAVAWEAAVARQQEFGKEHRVPWGISESGFAVLSSDQDYQYQSFGVPGLGLKRGLAKDLVVAPYATLLAVSQDAAGAVANFTLLREAGGEGPFGFYEAIDFTPDRLDRGERCRVIRSYMAHHQGMGLCAIANRLTGDAHCRRLSTEPAVRAVELLLQERVPIDAPEVEPPEEETERPQSSPDVEGAVSRRLTTADTPAPRAHLLSNGNYSVMVTNAGGGFSMCRGLAITRWRTDSTRDHHGSFLYVRDLTVGRLWSVAHQPTGAHADSYEVVFSADKAEFRRRDGAIETWTEVAVAPDRDAEIRRVTLVNHDTRAHQLEVTSYVELALIEPRADLAHPAFGKLFLETEWHPQWDALLCRRRPRSANQTPSWAVHVLAAEDPGGSTEYETDRASFLGRRHGSDSPEALTRKLGRRIGAVLDPCFSLRRTLTVAPGTSVTISVVTAVTASREDATALADHYHSPVAGARAFDLAWAHSRVELRYLGVTAAESHVFQRLAGHVLFPPPALRSVTSLQENRQSQAALWRFGISGDLPIVTICVSDGDGLPLAKQALKAHAFWRGRGFTVDLVLVADRPASYREELTEDLSALIRASDSRDWIDKPGGVYVRKAQPGTEDRTLLLAFARVVLYGDRGTLTDQTDAIEVRRPLPQGLVPRRVAEPEVPKPVVQPDLQFANGVGGFTADGQEYVITGIPPAPWVNVIASPTAGFLATDSGLGCTWVGNSQASRLTPWTNDPVADPPGEVVYLRDEETGAYWSVTPLPGRGCATEVRHRAGSTTYSGDRDGLHVAMTVFVALTDPVKLICLRVTNRRTVRRTFSATYFAEWVLGTTREQSAPFVVTEVDAASGALLARCAFDGDFGNGVAFADTNLRPRTLTGNRYEFLGRNRSTSHPAALGRVGLSGQTGAGLDPCAALHAGFTVSPGESAEIVFVLGLAPEAATASRLATQYREPAVATATLQEVSAAWDRRLTAVQVKTPDPALNVMVNHWLPYQVLSCRLWGRTALYQSGGAYGFRDQLQDVLSLLYAEPGEARTHILRAAARQFPEGDVQHWWHPPTGRGVRTRFSDDFLWLPFAVARYVEVTGDAAILDEPTRFLRGPGLRAEEQEEYFLPTVSDDDATLYQHCLLALEHGWKLGAHSIPLMGCGDWNDGMNLVGVQGKGESVWVGWFQVAVRTAFAKLAEARGQSDTAMSLRTQAGQLREAIDTQAWDGEWYKRAWFDDGTPLGSRDNDECSLDSLPQSWSVLAGVGNRERAESAVNAAVNRLVSQADRLVKLFDPPFDHGTLNPGYIKGYVPGIRENGGQYTHAAVWLVQALAGLGRGGEALKLWNLLNPITHTRNAAEVARYRVEPYVIAADVYGIAPHTGRGGWTWYTGSASWFYRAAVETLLGLDLRADSLGFDPHIPAEWSNFEIAYRFHDTIYVCQVDNPDRAEHGVIRVELDGRLCPELRVHLLNDGRTHSVRVILGHFKTNLART